MNAVTTLFPVEDASRQLSFALRTMYERHAEREAALAISGVSFVDCVKANLGANHDSIKVTYIGPRKGNEQLNVRAQDVYKAWQAFLASDDARETRLSQLTEFVGEFEALVNEFMQWLVAYQPRYRAVTSFTDRQWLESVARLATARRIMENKHRAPYGFVDKVARDMTTMILTLRKLVLPNVARVSYRAGMNAERHGGDSQYDVLLATINDGIRSIVRSTVNGDYAPLEPLPAHVIPFRLLPERVSDALSDEGAIQ